MEEVDIFEVPDTPPERLMSRHKPRCNPHFRHSINHDLIRSSSNASKDADFFFNEANKARQLISSNEINTGTVKGRETIDLSCDSPCNVIIPKSCVGPSNGDNDRMKSRDKGKGIDLCSNAKIIGCVSSSSTGTSDGNNEKVACGPRRSMCGQKRLVRNGFISPTNIEQKRKIAKQEVVIISPPQKCTISPDFQHRHSNKMKGKVTVDDIVEGSQQSVKDRSNSNSEHPVNELTSIVEEGDRCWRTTRNHIRKPKLVQDFQDLKIETGGINGNRRLSSSYIPIGESSSSISNNPESLNVGSSKQISDSRSNRRHKSQHVVGPVIEVDDLQSPKAESHSICRDIQVESDEILARQLQEELYNESPRVVDTSEIDENIALWLQHHDESDSSFARQFQPRRVSQRNSRSSSNGSRLPTPPRQPSRLALLRRDFYRSRLNMRMERQSLAYNAAAAPRVNNILHIQRDFNEDDYEMLLALDDDDHQHGGASESQINALPQSIIQNADSEEACAVCLEPPTIGDTIRHLPCFHKFHKDCIDSWLRRKMSCPMCKSDVR